MKKINIFVVGITLLASLSVKAQNDSVYVATDVPPQFSGGVQVMFNYINSMC